MAGEWINDFWNIHTMQSIGVNELELHVSTWLNLANGDVEKKGIAKKSQ